MGAIRFRRGSRAHAALLLAAAGVALPEGDPPLRDAPVVWHADDRRGHSTAGDAGSQSDSQRGGRHVLSATRPAAAPGPRGAPRRHPVRRRPRAARRQRKRAGRSPELDVVHQSHRGSSRSLRRRQLGARCCRRARTHPAAGRWCRRRRRGSHPASISGTPVERSGSSSSTHRLIPGWHRPPASSRYACSTPRGTTSPRTSS